MAVEHSLKFHIVKRYHERRLWSTTMVRNAVVKAWINEAEFEEITGEVYTS